ncbi:MAG: DUF1460 domain-containing protein [Myxococcaceae bacterium]|nr:DUF1460 domain-containing protein [Myxococcaceae bacterium]MCI0672871.1 DUF1460 domain-containing protein [Myxococcaceae bacterium]
MSLSLPVLLLFAFAAAPAGERGATPWRELGEDAREALLRSGAAEPLAARVVALSAHFLGTPYQASPLGEGEGVDPDPLFRDDAVDCLTFVEQTLALALSGRKEDVGAMLAALRYDGAIRYQDRNHLMEAQWLPANLRKGFLRDITREVGGEATRSVEKVLTRTTWTSLSSRALALPRERQVTGRYPLQLVPIAALRPRMERLPEGSILLVVREERPLKATRITHMGFVVRKGRRVFLRHAARNAYGRVVDEDLDTFLTRNARYTRWPVEGVAVFAPQRPALAPRVGVSP